jgi:hypothetical protein
VKRLLLMTLLALAGCTRGAESTVNASNVNFDVEKLFDVDGCTVYRFRDGYYRYFTRCGCTVNTEWRESCGKNCTRHVEVPTGSMP